MLAGRSLWRVASCLGWGVAPEAMASILVEGPVPRGREARFDGLCRPSAGTWAACARTGAHQLGIFVRLLALGLLVAGCTEATESLHDLGRVRATFYKYHLVPESSRLDMPGERLAPAVACKEGKALDGFFDPCKPDPDQPELDAYGLPRARPAAKDRRPTAQPTLPTAKPATTKSAAAKSAVARPPSTKPAAMKPTRSAAKAAAVAKPAKKPLPPKKASKPKRQ